jgi:hypothetical protein
VGNDAQKLTWSDAFYNGNFSVTINPSVPSSSYCQPCYETAQAISNPQVTVQATAGSCPGNGSLNSGHPVNLSVTNVTLTPQ